jgi:hypothetical protein
VEGRRLCLLGELVWCEEGASGLSESLHDMGPWDGERMIFLGGSGSFFFGRTTLDDGADLRGVLLADPREPAEL